ncbi:uncharacterized protein GGS22DRAFT_30476 [Annulohypoxylon maeteangense]|uniref:uncharacterized protein n=1 Tax=Annulohypoxylon maeteangense TaxID=1927788 RepID=UPI002008A304|nr:uncharacterized protein GGS22DRAFT_30476 [Annulohypoxylon maeteangense]KAI0883422.1 hypothetical protein GGS22DRAFT_30476 [Annulohypoxylon maeteangense]
MQYHAYVRTHTLAFTLAFGISPSNPATPKTPNRICGRMGYARTEQATTPSLISLNQQTDTPNPKPDGVYDKTLNSEKIREVGWLVGR